MVLDFNYTNYGDYFVIYTNIESLHCRAETNIMLCVNCIWVKKTIILYFSPFSYIKRGTLDILILFNSLLNIFAILFMYFSTTYSSPGCCGSVDWALASKTKGHHFDSQSRHMPGLWARSPVGSMWEATTQWFSLPPLPPPFPSL